MVSVATQAFAEVVEFGPGFNSRQTLPVVPAWVVKFHICALEALEPAKHQTNSLTGWL